MEWIPSVPFPRASLTYRLEGLGTRDAIVLRSYMRVLDHRLDQHWTCVHGGADVHITPDARHRLRPGGASALRLGCKGDDLVLSLPLRTEAVERAFNHMGAAVMRAFREAREDTPPAFDDQRAYRLLRWPTDGLLDAPERLQLAALMSARPCSVQSLQQRSMLPPATCRAFLRDLMSEGLLATASEPAPGHGHAFEGRGPAPGLLSRIRARLGLALGSRG